LPFIQPTEENPLPEKAKFQQTQSPTLLYEYIELEIKYEKEFI